MAAHACAPDAHCTPYSLARCARRRRAAGASASATGTRSRPTCTRSPASAALTARSRSGGGSCTSGTRRRGRRQGRRTGRRAGGRGMGRRARRGGRAQARAGPAVGQRLRGHSGRHGCLLFMFEASAGARPALPPDSQQQGACALASVQAGAASNPPPPEAERSYELVSREEAGEGAAVAAEPAGPKNGRSLRPANAGGLPQRASNASALRKRNYSESAAVGGGAGGGKGGTRPLVLITGGRCSAPPRDPIPASTC